MRKNVEKPSAREKKRKRRDNGDEPKDQDDKNQNFHGCRCRLEKNAENQAPIAQVDYTKITEGGNTKHRYRFGPVFRSDCTGNCNSRDCTSELSFKWEIQNVQPFIGGSAGLGRSHTKLLTPNEEVTTVEITDGGGFVYSFTLSVIITLRCVAKRSDGGVIEGCTCSEAQTQKQRFSIKPP